MGNKSGKTLISQLGDTTRVDRPSIRDHSVPAIGGEVNLRLASTITHARRDNRASGL